MRLFKKKKETKSCCCNSNCTTQNMQKTENKKQENNIKILGAGCSKCIELENSTKTALSELQLDYVIEHITDFAEIASYGVMSTPALVFNDEVISYGKVLTVEEIKALLTKKLNTQ